MQFLTGTLLYVQAQNPVDCYDKEKGKEWKASIAVDEDQADAFSEAYPKGSVKKVKASAFEEEFKIPPPEGYGKNIYVITLRKNSKYRDKETGEQKDVPEKYKPKVFLRQEDGTKKDITQEILVANGSKGTISIEVGVSQYGVNARLKNILVTDLIVYEREERPIVAQAGDEFDNPQQSTPPAAPKKPVAPSAKPAGATPKVAAKKPVEVTLDDDEDPFN